MIFSRPVNDLIRERYSCRSYTSEPVSPKDLSVLEAFLPEEAYGPFDSQCRFELITATDERRAELKKLGTYGLIKNPAGYIAGAVVPAELSHEDFGYITEKIILKITDLGLGTCWLGGTLRRSSFAEKMRLSDDEIMPAVVALGYIASKRTLREGISRAVAKSDHRRYWGSIFFDGTPENPLDENDAGEYTEALHMLRIAPSASNRQPWRVIKDRNKFHFYLLRDPKYTQQLKKVRAEDLQRVDMGIALCHFELSAREAGLDGTWQKNTPDIHYEDAEHIITWKCK